MHPKPTSIAIQLLFGIWLSGCAAPIKSGANLPAAADYLGQTPPGETARLFAPGIVSTGLNERDMAITPDGNEIYFCAQVGRFAISKILVSRRIGDHWSKPELAEFSNQPQIRDIEPAISPDGQNFFFSSDRPDPTRDKPEDDFDIWFMTRTETGWSKPKNLGSPVNTNHSEFFPSLTRAGTLYFTRGNPETHIDEIYRSKSKDGAFLPVEKLGPEVNSGITRFNAFISPSEDFLILSIYGRNDSLGSTDYYIVFRNPDDSWQGPINLGGRVNTTGGTEYSPYISPDGKYLFFMSSKTAETGEHKSIPNWSELQRQHNLPQTGNSDIYWISADFLRTLRP